MPAITRKGPRGTSEQKLTGPETCSEGAGYGRHNIPPHPKIWQGKYDDPSRNLRGVKLTRNEAVKSYYCRFCKAYQGCGRCIEDLATLVCRHCHDWANEISERVHGRMVKDPDLKRQGMKLVMMVNDGKLDFKGFTKLWDQARKAAR